MIDWIEEEIDSMVSFMNNDQIPEPNLSCKNCAYSEQYAKLVCNPVKDNKEIQGNFVKYFLNQLIFIWHKSLRVISIKSQAKNKNINTKKNKAKL